MARVGAGAGKGEAPAGGAGGSTSTAGFAGIVDAAAEAAAGRSKVG